MIRKIGIRSPTGLARLECRISLRSAVATRFERDDLHREEWSAVRKTSMTVNAARLMFQKLKTLGWTREP